MMSTYYTLVRFVPDLVRGELFNVAVLVADERQLIPRTLVAPTRAWQAVMSATDIQACLEIGEIVQDRFVKWRERHSEAHAVEFLRSLCNEGLSGFIFDAPLERLRNELEPTAAIADKLFDRLVAPQRVFHPAFSQHRSRARTLVMDLIAREKFPMELVPRKVTVRSTNVAALEYDFDFACSNGKLTFGQTIDLDVKTQQAQEKNAIAAIANAAEIGAVLSHVNVLNAIKVSDQSPLDAAYVERIGRWGPTFILPEHEELFIRYLKRSAEHDVAESIRRLGHEVRADDGAIEVLVEDPRQPLAPLVER